MVHVDVHTIHMHMIHIHTYHFLTQCASSTISPIRHRMDKVLLVVVTLQMVSEFLVTKQGLWACKQQLKLPCRHVSSLGFVHTIVIMVSPLAHSAST